LKGLRTVRHFFIMAALLFAAATAALAPAAEPVAFPPAAVPPAAGPVAVPPDDVPPAAGPVACPPAAVPPAACASTFELVSPVTPAATNMAVKHGIKIVLLTITPT